MRAKAQCRPRMRSSLGRRHRRRSQEVVTHRRWRRAPRNAGSYPAGVVSQPVADGARPMQGHSKSHQQRILRLQKLPQCMLSTLRLIAVRSAPHWSAAEVCSMQQQGHAGRPAPAAKPERKQDLGAARDEADDAGVGHAPGRAARAAPAAAGPARRAARLAVLGAPAAGGRRVRGPGCASASAQSKTIQRVALRPPAQNAGNDVQHAGAQAASSHTTKSRQRLFRVHPSWSSWQSIGARRRRTSYRRHGRRHAADESALARACRRRHGPQAAQWRPPGTAAGSRRPGAALTRRRRQG